MTRTNFPLAYHITFGTYGTRLHGSDRPTVDRSQNKFGDPIIGKDTEWETIERSLLKFPPRILTMDQRLFVEQTIPEICVRGGWEHVTTAAAKDHVHNIIRANVEGLDIRKWLKRWISQAMIQRWPLLPEQVWWAECGSVKWIWEQDYYGRAVDYVVGAASNTKMNFKQSRAVPTRIPGRPPALQDLFGNQTKKADPKIGLLHRSAIKSGELNYFNSTVAP